MFQARLVGDHAEYESETMVVGEFVNGGRQHSEPS